MNNLSGPKEYRYWNQRLKNAMDQARPKYGRRLITLLEGITEKMVNNQEELSEKEGHRVDQRNLRGEAR